jgi:hypothetical protein
MVGAYQTPPGCDWLLPKTMLRERVQKSVVGEAGWDPRGFYVVCEGTTDENTIFSVVSVPCRELLL